MNAKADLKALNYLGGNALHSAAGRGRTTEVITFLCNAGVNPNHQAMHRENPLHFLCGSGYATPAKMVPLLWAGTSTTSLNAQGESPLYQLAKNSPELVPAFKALTTLVPQVKAEKTQEYEQIPKLLDKHITQTLAPMVMLYTGHLPGHLYDVRYWTEDIEPRMKKMLENSQATTKKSRSKSPIKKH